MQLLRYIETVIADPATSKADVNDYKGVYKTLSTYLDGTDTDMLCLTQPQWIDAYYDYLISQYRSNKQRNQDTDPCQLTTIANRYVKQLRKLINNAIASAAFPDIDIFGETKIEVLLGRRKSVSVTPLTPDFKRLVFSSDHRLLSICEPYLISLYCCGIELDRLNTLRADYFNAETLQIYLPHLRITATYPETLFYRVYNYVMDNQDNQTDPSKVMTALRAQGYRLYASGSAFVDWISLAIESGISKDIKRLISLKLDTTVQPTAGNIRNVQAMVRILGTRYNRNKKSWYVLRTVGQPGSAVAQRLIAQDSQYPISFKMGEEDVYVPHIQPAVRCRKNRPKIVDPSSVLKNVVFFNAESKEAETIDRTIPDAYVMGKATSTGKEYQTVPYREIYTLQLVLRSISSTQAQEALLNEELRDTVGSMSFAIDDIVSVSIPGFEEYPARVTAVRRDSTYDLVVTSGPFKVDLKNIPKGLIKPVK